MRWPHEDTLINQHCATTAPESDPKMDGYGKCARRQGRGQVLMRLCIDAPLVDGSFLVEYEITWSCSSTTARSKYVVGSVNGILHMKASLLRSMRFGKVPVPAYRRDFCRSTLCRSVARPVPMRKRPRKANIQVAVIGESSDSQLAWFLAGALCPTICRAPEQVLDLGRKLGEGKYLLVDQ
jgi:hypothetical protein